MDLTYVNYGVWLASRHNNVSMAVFLTSCIRHVSSARFNQHPHAVRAAFTAHLLPSTALFPCRLLIDANLLPFERVMDLLVHSTALGVAESSMDVCYTADGVMHLSLSLQALGIFAERYPGVRELLRHASLIFTAYSAYNMNGYMEA